MCVFEFPPDFCQTIYCVDHIQIVAGVDGSWCQAGDRPARSRRRSVRGGLESRRTKSRQRGQGQVAENMEKVVNWLWRDFSIVFSKQRHIVG